MCACFMVGAHHHGHTVQVYESDRYLSQRVVDFLSAGLIGDDRCVVVATRPHRELVCEGLVRAGVDCDAAVASGRLIMLDAQETLDAFMYAGAPDPVRFEAVVGTVIARATRYNRRVRAFGEMVDLLWRDGHPEAALELERLWNGLATKHDFDLLCAYTMANLYKTSSGRLHEICELHDDIGAETNGNSHDHDPVENEGIRTLVTEIARRAAVERELRTMIRAMQDAETSARVRATRNLQLQQATAQLANAVALGELTDTIISASVHLAGAHAAAVYIADADGRFRLHASRNIPNLTERWPILPLDAPTPLARVLATGTTLWIEGRDDLQALFPNLDDELLAKSRTHAVAALPLVHGGRVVGGISLSFETRRAFSSDERDWLASFAVQCTLALERVRHFVAEQKARNDAENLLRIAESLNDMHLDLDAILQRVTDEATGLVGAQFGAFFYNVEDERGESYMLYTLSGAKKEAFSKLGMPRKTPLFAHTFAGNSIVRVDDVREDSRYGQVGPHFGLPAGHLPVASYLAVPVRSRTGAVIGALLFGHEEVAKFTAQHEQTLRALAITAAIAIDNAELYRTAREAEEAQRKSVEQLVDTVRMNDLFTGVLAHDLRSPLFAITSGSELLGMRATDNDKRVIDRVLASARRMSRMIEQLLDFTRIRVGAGFPLETKLLDLEQLVSHVVDEQRIAHKPPIALTTTGDTHGRWDDDRLAQAFSNLIGNAAQHGQAGEISVAIDGTDKAVVRVRIHNAGAIPAELVPRIFEPMIGGQRRRDGTRGLGIGLFITREIATSHGGSITVDSSPDAGTTFTLSLPREVASVEVVSREAQAPVHEEPGVDLGQRMRTLVEGVRDHAIFMLDPVGRVQTWSHASEQITGWSRADIVGRSIDALYTNEARNVLDIEFDRAKLGNTTHERWLTRRDGTQFWAAVSLSVLRSGSNDLVGYAMIMRDLTQHRAARAKLEENDARMRLMIDSVRDYAIFLLDADGKVASWNRGAQLTKGYTPGEIIGRHIETFYTRDDREAGRPQQLLDEAIREGRVEDEGWRIRKDGSRFWADVVITALCDDDGELRGFTKVTRDLTDRRRAEEDLKHSEERFRLLVESVKDYAIFMLDRTGHILTWNLGAERNKGYKPHEIIGQHFSKFYDPAEVRAGKCERELEIAVRDGKFEEEGWRYRNDGTRFWASVIITPLRDANGEVLGFAKVTRDLTERKTLEEERMRAMQAQDGIRLRDEFLSIVSHELKTPLAGLLLQIDALASRSMVDNNTNEKLRRAKESGERLDNLIEALLDVSRIATGRFVLKAEPFDMVEAVRSTIDSFQMAATKANSEITLRAPEALVGSWDRVRMNQVIANLLSNAIKYGAGHPIEMRLAQEGSDVVLELRDHGPGVDPTMFGRIFDRFERAVSTRHFGGLGIGLYVVREIVTAHGGKVGVENSPDGGARFTVRLPMETS